MPVKNRFSKNVMRDAQDLTLTNPVDGLYNQLLFDLCGENDLISLSLMGMYNPVIDAIGVINSDVHRIVEDFITYVAPDGTANETPSSGILTQPCEPGNTVESGGCSFVLEGWTRFRRSSPTRDITDGHMKYCKTQPIYDIQGNAIDDDYEWDMVRMMSVLLQDFQRWLISGNGSIAGETDGLWNLVDYNYVNPVSGELCKEMDSFVIDWDGQAMAPEGGAEGVTINGDAAPDGYTLIDYIKSYVTHVARRINMSSLRGTWNFMAVLPTEALSCLMSAYVCQTVCGGEIERMDSFEARAKLESLRSQLGGHGAVTMTFDGYGITFFPYDYELVNDDGTFRMIFFVPTVGNTPLLRIHSKDMSAAVAAINMPHQRSEFLVTDRNRVLSWATADHTCYQTHIEMQSRIYARAPWTMMKIDNVACDTLFGIMSGDPLSSNFFGTFTPHQTAPANAVMQVLGNGVVIASGDATPGAGDHTEFAATTVGNPVTRTYTIANTGNAQLVLGAITLPSGFAFNTMPDPTIDPGDTTTFVVRSNAASAATFSGNISIPSNDSATPYTFAISSTVAP